LKLANAITIRPDWLDAFLTRSELERENRAVAKTSEERSAVKRAIESNYASQRIIAVAVPVPVPLERIEHALLSRRSIECENRAASLGAAVTTWAISAAFRSAVESH
jgi:hypothetical protein